MEYGPGFTVQTGARIQTVINANVEEAPFVVLYGYDRLNQVQNVGSISDPAAFANLIRRAIHLANAPS